MPAEKWNAFDDAQAEEVQHRSDLGHICGAEITLYHQTIICRKTHRQGDREHETFVTDDFRLNTVRISWMEPTSADNMIGIQTQ